MGAGVWSLVALGQPDFMVIGSLESRRSVALCSTEANHTRLSKGTIVIAVVLQDKAGVLGAISHFLNLHSPLEVLLVLVSTSEGTVLMGPFSQLSLEKFQSCQCSSALDFSTWEASSLLLCFSHDLGFSTSWWQLRNLNSWSSVWPRQHVGLLFILLDLVT